MQRADSLSSELPTVIEMISKHVQAAAVEACYQARAIIRAPQDSAAEAIISGTASLP